MVFNSSVRFSQGYITEYCEVVIFLSLALSCLLYHILNYFAAGITAKVSASNVLHNIYLRKPLTL